MHLRDKHTYSWCVFRIPQRWPHDLGSHAGILCSVSPWLSHCTCPGVFNKTSSNSSKMSNRNAVTTSCLGGGAATVGRRGGECRKWRRGRQKKEGETWYPAKDGMQPERDVKTDGQAVCSGLFFWGRADSRSVTSTVQHFSEETAVAQTSWDRSLLFPSRRLLNSPWLIWGPSVPLYKSGHLLKALCEGRVNQITGKS